MPDKYSRLSKRKRAQLLHCFVENLSATQAAAIAGLNRNTANGWHRTFRERMAAHQELMGGGFSGEVELDEPYFGGPRKKRYAADRRKRGRGAENKVPVFGIKKREDGKAHAQIIKNASKHELLPIIRKIVKQRGTMVFTDKWGAYDGLVLDGYRHRRINHSKQHSDRRGTHVNGIEDFWSYAKRRLAKFNGVSRLTFCLHLKECEFRYNMKGDILKTIKRLMRDLPV